MTGTRVTCVDLETGESESKVITDDYIVITDGLYYIDGINVWPKTGTAQITVRRAVASPRGGETA